MLRATLKSLLARKLRLVLSATAVVLGVSFVVGALVLTDSLSRTFDTLFSSVNKNIAVDVRGTVLADTGSGDQTDVGSSARREVPAAVLEQVRRVDGVVEAQPAVNGVAVLVGADNKVVGGNGAPNIGTNWVDSTRLNPMYISEGTKPTGPNDIVIDADLAKESKKGIGQTATVLFGNTGQREFKIVGIARLQEGNAGSLAGATLIMFTTPTAQHVLGLHGGYSEVQAAAVGGVGQQELRDRVAAALPNGLEAITGTQLAEEQSSDVKSFLGFLNTFLLVFAGVALFVGAFIILNTFTILIAQRTRELAMMRALGASRGQVMRSVLVESVVVGTVASAIGLGLGVGVALGLKALFGAFGAGLPAGPTVLLGRTVIAAFAVGIVITVLSALIPARRAAKVAPVEAMREAATPDRPLTRQTVGGAIVLVAGVVSLCLGMFVQGSLELVGLGALLGFVGISMLSPLLSRPVARMLGALFSRRLPGRLGRQNSLRNPRRTASTAAALMIGLALVAAIGVLGASVKESIQKVVDSALGADYILNSQATNFTDQALKEAQSQPGVAAVTGLRGDSVRLDNAKESVLALPRDALGLTVALKQERGSLQELGPGTILVSDKLAKDKGWQVGRSFAVQYGNGDRGALRLAGTYADNQLVGNYVVDDSAAANFHSQLYFAGLVKVEGGANKDQVRSELENVIKPYPNIQLQDRSQFIGEATKQIDQIVQFLTVLLVLSVLIAVLGIVNTLALSVLERTRELGLLRAVGMSRRQVRRMVRVEAVIVAVFGGLLGLAVGAVLGLALQHGLADQGVTELAFPVGQLLVYLLLAALAGVAAAWLPARRASRLNVLQAIATE